VDIIINKRPIPIEKWASGVVWFSFDVLCNTARSAKDYTEIANMFHTVFISNIAVMDNSMDDIARRFVNLIDSFYDSQVNLLVSAEAAPEQLYVGKRLTFEFQRTVSRLTEMQSKEYISLKHLR
jgi:cell division protein ZapE